MPDGGGAFHIGYHPLYGRTAFILDGTRYGLLTSHPGDLGESFDHPSKAMADGGPAWASLVATGVMLAA